MSDFVKKVKNIVGHAPKTIRDESDYGFDDSKYADINSFENGRIPEPKSALHKFWHGDGKYKTKTRKSDLFGGDDYNDDDYPTIGGDVELRKKKTTSKPKRKPVKKCKCK
jgi:hypothetical protein